VLFRSAANPAQGAVDALQSLQEQIVRLQQQMTALSTGNTSAQPSKKDDKGDA